MPKPKPKTSKGATTEPTKSTPKTTPTIPPRELPSSDQVDVGGGESNAAEWLLGSSVQPSVFQLEDGTELCLGDVVARAHVESELSVEDWNALTEEDRESRIAVVVDGLELAEPDTEPDTEPDAEPDAEPDTEPDAEPDAAQVAAEARAAESSRRSAVFEAVRRNVRAKVGPLGYDFEGTITRIRELARGAVVQCADADSAAFLLGLIVDQVSECADDIAARRGWEVEA